jgi:hypothetical protein
VDNFGARKILTESGLFDFESGANLVLEGYLEQYASNDVHENQFRSNMASIAAAEFAVWRAVLNSQSPLEPQRPVLEFDALFAILTADTLRTRPCRTAGATKRGLVFATDLFMFTGDASKARYALEEVGSNILALDSWESFLNLNARLSSMVEEANQLQILESELGKSKTLFAYMRMNVARNQRQSQVEENFQALLNALGILGALER